MCEWKKTGVEISARKNEKMQMMKMQEWKHRHDFSGVENAGVEVIELRQQENLLTIFSLIERQSSQRALNSVGYKIYCKISRTVKYEGRSKSFEPDYLSLDFWAKKMLLAKVFY